MEIVRKVFPVASKDASIADNRITGAASVMGVMDNSWARDVMCPGCYKGALEDFKKDGFVPTGHDWSDYSELVAMPMVVEERGRQLYTEAVFHTTQFAQDVRTVCKERMDMGLSVGLSVGFGMGEDGCVWFPNGKELWAWATGKGFDMALFDPNIQAYEDDCRAISQVGKLYEYSIVTVPANPHATVDSVKSFPISGCVTLAERASAVCAAAGQVKAEIERLVELRSADGRIPIERLKQAGELGALLLSLAESVSEPAEEAVEEAPDDAAREKALQLEAETFLVLAN